MENYLIANCTDTGLVRSVNEDSMVTFDSPNGRVVVVCDGMGGQNAGDVASALAISVIQDILTDNTFATAEEAIRNAIIAANQALLHRAAGDSSLSGMGSTCAMLIVRDGKVYYGWVGDSRVYYINDREIHQITKDQSYVQTLVDEGTITQEAAEHHQDKNQITNALGMDGMTPPQLCPAPITPQPGSIFLICSDGLSGMVSNNTMLNTALRNDLTLSDRAKLLVRQANEAGGLDNITVQLVEFTQNVPDAAVYGTGTPDKKKKKSNAMLYTLVSVVLLLLVGGGIFWKYHSDKQIEAEVQKAKTEQIARQKKAAEIEAKRRAAEETRKKAETTTTDQPTVVVSATSTQKPKSESNRVAIKIKTEETKDPKELIENKKEQEEAAAAAKIDAEMRASQKKKDEFLVP